MHNISLILFSAGALAYFGAALVLVRNRAKIFVPALAILTLAGLAAWQALLAWNAAQALPANLLIGAELGRAVVLIGFMHFTLRAAAGAGLTRGAVGATVAFAIVLPAVLSYVYPVLVPAIARDFVLLRAWTGVFVSVGLLIGLEQVFRNAGAPLTVLHFTCLALGITVVYDLYLFSDTLIFERLEVETWRARGGINAIAAVFLAVSVSRSRVARAISFSRNVVFYSASLTMAGLFLLTVSVVGYAMRKSGGSWGTVLQLMLFFSALLFVVASAISPRMRDRLRNYITTNFFVLRYDYRQEWLHLIGELSRTDSEEHLYVRAIRVLADLYKCPGGVLWLRQEERFAVAAVCRMRRPEDCEEPVDSRFCVPLAQGWIYDLAVTPPRGVELPPLPAWIAQVPDLGVVVPLLVEKDLIGFIGLQRSLGFSALTWEDLEILKTAARQVASYIARHQAAEQLARARQFDTYHQLTAFIMHDLKNLIAQQELVVKNAAKHKENPAFVEDAIDTIQNSVARMSTLLGKLQQREPADPRPVALREVLVEAVRKNQAQKPKPALRIEHPEARVLSDRDHLVMILSHIIKNAQEATRKDGFVDVTLRCENGHAVVVVEDNGSGMDEEFVRTRLFRPFESTKAGKGMGIGTFQAREFIRSLGGDIVVSSKPGAGSTFTLTIPLALTDESLKVGAAH